MTQLVASRGEVDIVNFIGNHEMQQEPPSVTICLYQLYVDI